MTVSYSQDIRRYGTIHTDENPNYGIQLAQALFHDYTTHYRRSGAPPLLQFGDFVGYVSSTMEGVEGFTELSETARNHVLLAGVGVLGAFIDEIDQRFGELHPVETHYHETHRKPVSLVLVV